MAQTRRQRYDIALDGQGLVLARRPEQPLIVCDQDAVFGARYAQGDRTYDDLARWWFDAQTDWSGGIKEDLTFRDDAHYWYSSNIDAFSEIGSFRLAKDVAQYGTSDFPANIVCGASGEVGSQQNRDFVGCDDGADNIPHVYELTGSGGYNNITYGYMTANQNVTSQLHVRNNMLWVHTVGNGATRAINTWTGGGWTDQDTFIETALGWQFGSSRCGCELGGAYYAAVDAYGGRYAILSTASDNPTSATDWTVRVNRSSRDLVIDMIGYNSQIYYLLYKGGYGMELRVYDPTTSIDTHVESFPQASVEYWGVGGKYLFEFNGKLVITVPGREVWELSSTMLTRVYYCSDVRQNLYAEAKPYLNKGGVKHNGRIRWGNLVYDGYHFYNDFRNPTDSISNQAIPLFVNTLNAYWLLDAVDPVKLYSLSGYHKKTTGNNYLVFSNYDRVSAIDKQARYVTVLYQKLLQGQKITVEYSTDQMGTNMTWTALGTISYQNDYNTTQKTLYFGDDIIFKKIWIRVKLDLNDIFSSDLSQSPTVTDVVMSYLPMPDKKMRWKFTVKCMDSIARKDKTREPKRGIDIRNLLLQSWWKKKVLLFEDFDAEAKEKLQGQLASTANTIQVHNSTDNFSEKGYLLIDSEYILYSGKTKTSFLNCTRGARGTVKASHNASSIVSAAHRVIIDDYQEQLMVANDPTVEEYFVTLTVFEV